MPRVLLLLPTTSYRTSDFLAAAERLKVDVVVASEIPNTMAKHHPGRLLCLDFKDPEQCSAATLEYQRKYPIDAVIPVDDDTAVVAAAIGAALGLRHNSIASAQASRNKHTMIEMLHKHGVPAPRFRLFATIDDPLDAAESVGYPCVLKPVFLAASRGVIRADTPAQFVEAWYRILAILAKPEVADRGREAAKEILAEEFIQGVEVAVEGLLRDQKLRVLALFDKPDPLDGPYFEETLYVTPSRLDHATQESIADCVQTAAAALGLQEGPVHAELRLNERGPWIIEVASRSIGGLCARTLRFGTGLSLEEIILRHALELEVSLPEREANAAGVMMIPIPGPGILQEVHGLAEAKAVPLIEDVVISAHIGKRLIPLPEGSSYLGFIFARGETSALVEASLREAHSRLQFEMATD